jgi:predicted enzyme related to lactoylglutathione lyase
MEIPTDDVKKSGEFYKKLFNWRIDYSWRKDYATFSAGEDQLGGGLDSSEQARSLRKIIVYILVDDIDLMLEKAVRLGAKKTKGKTEIPNVGWFGLFSDLDGNTIGLFTLKK